MNETTVSFKSAELIDCFRLPTTFTHWFGVFIYLPVNYVTQRLHNTFPTLL